jgi:hypothetical protein
MAGVALACTAMVSSGQPGGRPGPPAWQVAVLAAGERMAIDGRLDDAAWSRAAVWDSFVRHLPAAGDAADPAWRTEVRLVVETEALVIGIRARDPDPATIRAPLLRRDRVGRDQDFVSVLLDPSGERRSATVVRVNPRGVLADGLFIADRTGQVEGNDGDEDLSPDFDLQAEARQDDDGWTAEVRVPFAALRLPHTPAGQPPARWQMMVTRSIPRDAAVLLTSGPVPRDALSFLAAMAPVDGLEAAAERLRDARFLVLRPSLVLRSGRDADGHTRRQASAGLDAKWRPRADWVVDATLNPDFSQVESDTPQLAGNTRFALSQIEKRPFFLESTDVLDLPLSSFYSRAVTDPRAGLRATWRGGGADATALAMRDDGGGLLLLPGPFATDAVPQAGVSDAALLRGRWHRELDAGGRLTVGGLATTRRHAVGGENRVAGVDVLWRPDEARRLRVRALDAVTTASAPGFIEGSPRRGSLVSVEGLHRADDWALSAALQRTSAGFRNDNGFVEQAGVMRTEVEGLLRHGEVALGSWVAHEAETFVWVEHRQALAGALPGLTAQTVSRRLHPGVWWTADRDVEAWIHAVLDAERVRPQGRLHPVRGVAGQLAITPAPWFTRLQLEAQWGERVDVDADRVGRGSVWTVDAQWRAALPIGGAGGAWGLELQPRWQQGTVSAPDGGRALVDTAARMLVVLHTDARHSLRAVVQGERTRREADAAAGLAASARRARVASLVAQRRLAAGGLLALGVTSERIDPGDGQGPQRRREGFVSVTVVVP